MHVHRPRLWAIFLVGMLATGSTLRAEDPLSVDRVAYFETHIRPLFVQHCYGCHSTRAGMREGGLLLDSRAGWTTGGDSGPAIVPADPDASLLIRAVRHSDADLRMPPDKALPKNAVARFEQWVRMGAPDPRDETAIPIGLIQRPSDPIAGREHWAFRPFMEHLPPVVAASGSPRSSIDAFILARLEAANLQPADDADRRTLLRRVFMQLIGLPPTAEQMTAFLNDDSENAYEKQVEQLLQSREFGRRWGRHWLDLARYADSNGLDENFLFREAWRYRNQVIDAINADLPFDRFLVEQIAGDLLPYDSIDQRDRQRIAAGFLVIGPKVLLGNDPNERRMDVADEQLDTIGRAILGQTIGCARCHDHKFDPLPTADYYALAGILTSTQVMEQRYMLGQQRVMEQLIGLGADGETVDSAYETYWRERPKLQEQQKHATSALGLLEQGNVAAFDALVAKHSDSIAEAVTDTSRAMADRIADQKTFIAGLDAAIANPPAIPPRAMCPTDSDQPTDEAIRLAGQFNRPGDVVPRGTLRVISDRHLEIPDGQSGRMELAQWLTDVDHGAGRLTARVLANRVWHHLTGCGIVRTVDNFGRTGEPPSHPELLDALARDLIESDWSLKTLVRNIVLSRTFKMNSRHNEAAYAVDPENRLLWRANRRRLDPESLRDAMLLASGTLDLSPMDSTVSYLGDQATAVGNNANRRRTDFPCRSVYLPVIRNDLPELFDVFDFADPHATTGLRPQTMVATQGLFMLNDNSVMDAADAIAQRVLANASPGTVEQRLEMLFELVLNVAATDDERRDLPEFIRTTQQRLTEEGVADAELRAWAMMGHALLASSRFQILE